MREWSEAISETTENAGTVMVVGASDVGKTAFCLDICRRAFDLNISTTVVDSDVGQSSIGPPTTIGMGTVDTKPEALSDLKPIGLYFTGATTPISHITESIIGTKKLVDAAKAIDSRIVVVDTTGLVTGAAGRKLKTAKIDMIRPDIVVGIEREQEIDGLLVPFAKMKSIKIIRVQTPESVKRKSPEFRMARRKACFAKEFNEAQGHIIRLDDVALWNTWFRTGRPLSWQYVKFIEDTIHCHVFHAESTNGRLFVVAEDNCRRDVEAALQEQFKTSDITIATATSFTNLVVGLADENGHILGIGLIQAVDFMQMFLFVLSEIKTISPVKIVQFGSIRVMRNGTEVGTVKTGEL